jgi:hypothetical protein
MTARTAGSEEWLARKCRRVSEAASVRIDVFVRSLAPPPGPKQQQERALARLESLRRSGHVDDINVSVWGEAICLEGTYRTTPTCQRIHDRIDRFRTWARDESADVTLPFESRPVSSTIVDSEYRRLVPPRICVAAYVDGDLTVVLPCTVDESSVCVGDFLDELENDAAAERAHEPFEPRTTSQ